jgi:N-acetylmuramoyl-L-alanine amidase
MDVNGWADIGYNWLIGEDGNTYEGRGWDNQGAHSPGFNSVSQGICFIGSFTSEYFSTPFNYLTLLLLFLFFYII